MNSRITYHKALQNSIKWYVTHMQFVLYTKPYLLHIKIYHGEDASMI